MIANIAAARKRLGALLVLPLILAALALSPIVAHPHAAARSAAHISAAALVSSAGGPAIPEMPGPNK